MPFTLLSLVGFSVTFAATFIVRRLAFRYAIIDDPGKSARKIHREPIPLMGGLAIYVGLAVSLGIAVLLAALPEGLIAGKHLGGILLGGLFLLVGGILDDKYNFTPRQQIVWPICAVLVVIASGIGIESISNPVGGQWRLDQFDIPLLTIGGIPYKITLFADLFTFAWLMAMIYATKFFDGLDGLVSGITIIGSLVVYFTSLLPRIGQPETALLALIVASCFTGFLVWNIHPAKIFLGEAGSTLAGFLIGCMAIISGSKVVTTLVVMALPLLDLIWVVVRRMMFEKKSPAAADRKHIHHRLLDSGFSHRGAVLILYAWAIVLGIAAWFYQGTSEWIVLLVSFMAIIIFALAIVRRAQHRV